MSDQLLLIDIESPKRLTYGPNSDDLLAIVISTLKIHTGGFSNSHLETLDEDTYKYTIRFYVPTVAARLLEISLTAFYNACGLKYYAEREGFGIWIRQA